MKRTILPCLLLAAIACTHTSCVKSYTCICDYSDTAAHMVHTYVGPEDKSKQGALHHCSLKQTEFTEAGYANVRCGVPL
jgi:hypothetical protein